jgi:hypothetical protein
MSKPTVRVHSRSSAPAVNRSEIIALEGLRHAPENELGVVFLFSKVARRLGFVEIDRIQPQFPDCWALRESKKGTVRTWIEFEFKSRSFISHLGQLRSISPRRGIVVCWEHNWPECERYAEVLELRSLLGFGRKIWIQNTRPEFHNGLDDAPFRKDANFKWTVSGRARPGDLVLMYRAGTKSEARKWDADPDRLQSIANIFVVKARPDRDKRWGYQALVTRIALLKNPLHLDQMRTDRVLRHSPFVRASMLGRHDVTSYWFRLYSLITKLNPSIARKLQPFSPSLI